MNTMNNLRFLAAALALSAVAAADAQSITEKYARFLTEPHGYVAYRTVDKITVDGVMNEKSWQNAPETELFMDISGEGFPTPRYATRAKMLWDDDYLYVSAVMEEPNVWANLTLRDTVIYYDPDFEIFIDPTGDAHNYYELEFNASNVIFDLCLEMPYRAPRRNLVQFQWDCPGLKSAVKVNGTLNNNRDTDKGWDIEVAIPRKAIAQEFDNVLQAGRYLRVGFSRVEWQTELDRSGRTFRKKGADGKYLPEDNWTWPSTGMIAMHMPERWGYVYLSKLKAGKGSERFVYPDYRPVEKLLWAMFYAQEEQKGKTGEYFGRVEDFRLTPAELALLPKDAHLSVESMSQKYLITVDSKQLRMTIDEDGQILRTEKSPKTTTP